MRGIQIHGIRSKRVIGFAAAVAVAGLIAAGSALAAEQKSTRNEAEWVAYDAVAKTVKLKIKKLGLGPNAEKLKVGQEAVFNVQPEGSVLTRTSVAVNGKKGTLTDIKPGKTVLIYWVPDPKDAKAHFARKIDVILSEQELDERYGEAE